MLLFRIIFTFKVPVAQPLMGPCLKMLPKLKMAARGPLIFFLLKFKMAATNQLHFFTWAQNNKKNSQKLFTFYNHIPHVFL